MYISVLERRHIFVHQLRNGATRYPVMGKNVRISAKEHSLLVAHGLGYTASNPSELYKHLRGNERPDYGALVDSCLRYHRYKRK